MQAPKGRWASVLVLLSSLAFAFLLAEGSLRTFRPVRYGMPRQKFTDVFWTIAIHQASEVPGLAFEMAPHREKVHVGTTIRTNRFGMRDRDDLTVAKPDSVRRIAGIGDSYMFGFGVPVENNLPSSVERILNERQGGPRWEALNFGVSGYTTRDAALVLKHKAWRFDPDVILVTHVLNDPQIDPLLRPHNHFRDPHWWQHSQVLRLVAKARRDWDVKRLAGGNYTQHLYAHPEKWASVVRGLEDMRATAQDVPVLVVIFPFFPNSGRWDEYKYRNLHDKVAEAARAAGLEVLDLYGLFAGRDPAQLRNSIEDPHPNGAAYALVAEAVADFMVREGWATP